MRNFLGRVWNRLALEADAIKWSRSIKRLKGLSAPAPTKRVLICNLMPMLASSKVDALYATGLRNKGYLPVILMRRKDRFFEKVFKAAVPDSEFLYLENLMQKYDVLHFLKMAQNAWESFDTILDILNFESEGCRVGKNALSYTVRTFRIGQIQLDNEEHKARFLSICQESLMVAKIATDWLRENPIDMALFVEKGYTPAGEFYDACINANVRVIQWLGAPESGKLLYKGYNKKNSSVHPLSLSDQTWEKLKDDRSWTDKDYQSVVDRLTSHYQSGAWFNRQQLQTDKRIRSGEDILRQLDLDPQKKTAVIFSHIFYDATFFYGESLYPDYCKWLVETVRYAIDNPHLNWIVKVHPVNVWRSAMDGEAIEQLEKQALLEEFGSLPAHIKIMTADTDVNTFSLFNFIDFGITVRGTIGMELPCFGIPVVTAGSGRYAERGFTIDPESIENYREILLTLHQREKLNTQTIRLAQRYAFGTFFQRPVPMVSYLFDYEANTFNAPSLKMNTYMYANDYKECEDIKQFVEWAVRTDLEDFLWVNSGKS